jgi:pimeloyl-ACP methyl ester carboxylesterase
MIDFARHAVQCLSPSGLHRMAYKEWGRPDNPNLVVCVHGVTRVSDDFDELAQVLCKDFRVICPDVVGRGRSDQLRDPAHYQIPQYVADMVTLVARLNVEQVAWVGTSMGGLIGMALASLPGTPIARLVINDVGPLVNPGALARIGEYIGQPIQFRQFEDAVNYIRMISAAFGSHTDEQWRKLAADVLRRDENGMWTRNYDLRVAESIKGITPDIASKSEAALWAAYDAITCPTLLLRGQQSDLLSAQTAQEMTQRGPRARLFEFAGVGHAPTLLHADQIEVVAGFLKQ